MDLQNLIKETDKRIFEIKDNMESNAYELIEKDLLVASRQIRSYLQSDRPNNSANQMSTELRTNRVIESMDHCLEKMADFGFSLGFTFVAESDLYGAVTKERDLFSKELSNPNVDLKMSKLATRMEYFAEFVRENKDLNLNLSDYELGSE
jgi:hypothetical protein